MITRFVLPLGTLLLSGCLSGPFDGTWLFNLDPNPSYDGDCAPDADSDTTTFSGDSFDSADIYTTGGNGIVVLWDGVLRGEVSGKSFEALYEYMYASEDFTLMEGTTMEATVSGGILEGEVSEWEDNDYGAGDTYQCAVTYDFTAERYVSSPSKYIEE